MVSHGVHHIGHRQDPGFEDDLITHQPLRITRAIHALMVLEGGLGHRPGEIDSLEYFIAGLGMDLDE
jgi:hypothetical protein